MSKKMKIALAAVGFYDRDIEYNKNKILNCMKENSKKTDLILFGETFLQGFEALDWKYETDCHMAVSLYDRRIKEIQNAAKENKIAVSFGFFEKVQDKIYSSQLTIGDAGEVVHLFRRVSKGWREPDTDEHCKEGSMFTKFEYKGKSFSTGLCGDLWDNRNVKQVKALGADIVLWPVYVDFIAKEWNERIKYEYAVQAEKAGSAVLLVNSVCENSKEEDTAKGGAIYFSDGQIKKELPAGKEGILFVQV